MGGVIDRAICLRTWDWSETSQTALLFLRRLGLLRVLAKGARRPNSPFSGGLEAVTGAEARVFPRANGGLSTLGSWDLEDRFGAARATLSWFRASMYMSEVVSSSLTELDPHPRLFDTFNMLLASDPSSDPALAVLSLQWTALVEGGHHPDLSGPAVEPGTPLGDAVYWFAPLHGAVVADRRAAGEIWRVRAPTVELLRSLASGDPSESSPITLARAARFLDAYLRFVLGVELRSFESVFAAPETGGLTSER